MAKIKKDCLLHLLCVMVLAIFAAGCGDDDDWGSWNWDNSYYYTDSVHGYVKDDYGVPAAFVQVRLESRSSYNDSYNYSYTANTDESGYYWFGSVRTGSAEITVISDLYEEESRHITLYTGNNSIRDLTAKRRTGSLYGTVFEMINGAKIPVSGAVIAISCPVHTAQTTSDANGKFQFQKIPTDTYTMEGSKTYYHAASQTVSVPPRTDVTKDIQLSKIMKTPAAVYTMEGFDDDVYTVTSVLTNTADAGITQTLSTNVTISGTSPKETHTFSSVPVFAPYTLKVTVTASDATVVFDTTYPVTLPADAASTSFKIEKTLEPQTD